MAALHPGGKTLAVVSFNADGEAPLRLTFSPRGESRSWKGPARRFVTNAQHNCEELAQVKPGADGLYTMTLPPNSVQTLLFGANGDDVYRHYEYSPEKGGYGGLGMSGL